MLDDGIYDAFVVDVTSPASDGMAPAESGFTIELTIVAGPHKGEVVGVRAQGIDGDPLSLIGLPATLEVAGGQPRVTVER